MQHYDVAVVGAGPAGCSAARLIAAAGYRVIILEEHNQIGEPLQCSGLISPRTLELADYQGELRHALHGFNLHSPAGHTLGFQTNKTYAVAVDRVALDRQLADAARAAGAELITGARVGRLQYADDGIILHAAGTAVKARLVIAADGARSSFARRLGLRPREIIPLAAAEIELGPGSRAREDVIELFLGQDLAPGWFGWLFPAGKGRARIGVGVGLKGPSPRRCLDMLLKRYPEYFSKAKILRYTSGCVPIGPPPRFYGERVMLLGDAAAQVKPISGGGLYLGLHAARHCARTAIQALEQKDFSAAVLAGYQEAWEKEFGAALRSDLVLRELFLSLNDTKADYLTRFFDNSFWRQFIARYADIDYPSVLVKKILGTGLLPRKFFQLALDLGGFIGRIVNREGNRRSLPALEAGEYQATT
ncbi:MAG: hypothetical protein PWQ98_1569 [Moorella sp. (in: firmicutes)]|nr:hypothetical protein [Moorella sp. (in: firmicutes)]